MVTRILLEIFGEPNAPAGSIGYRFQKAEGGFIFRTGIGFPDGLYVSAGFRF